MNEANFWWLFSAYSIVWLALIAFAGMIFSKQKSMEKEIERLKRH